MFRTGSFDGRPPVKEETIKTSSGERGSVNSLSPAKDLDFPVVELILMKAKGSHRISNRERR
jgi:hypothetical protein